MSKESYSVLVGTEQGRISNLRLNEDKKVVGTFVGIGCSSGRTVLISEAKGANNKSAKNIQAEVEVIQQRAQKIKNKS